MESNCLRLPGAEALAQAHQQQQGTDAPRDPKHGQKRAQLVRPERARKVCPKMSKMRRTLLNHYTGLETALIALGGDLESFRVETRVPPTSF